MSEYRLRKISYKEAVKRFNEDKEVYLLYDDGTEGLAETLEDMERHHKNGGEFGVE